MTLIFYFNSVNKMFWAPESYGQWTAMISVSGQRLVTKRERLSGVTPGPAQRGGNERKSAECWPYMIHRGHGGWWPAAHIYISTWCMRVREVWDAWLERRWESEPTSEYSGISTQNKMLLGWNVILERLNEFELDTPCLWNLVSECDGRTRRVGR